MSAANVEALLAVWRRLFRDNSLGEDEEDNRWIAEQLDKAGVIAAEMCPENPSILRSQCMACTAKATKESA